MLDFAGLKLKAKICNERYQCKFRCIGNSLTLVWQILSFPSRPSPSNPFLSPPSFPFCNSRAIILYSLPTFPSPLSLPFPSQNFAPLLPSPVLPFLPLLSLNFPFPSIPLLLHSLRSRLLLYLRSGERCKLPSGVSPSMIAVCLWRDSKMWFSV